MCRYCYSSQTGTGGAVAMSSTNGLVGTGFASRYRFPPTISCNVVEIQGRLAPNATRKEANVLFNDVLSTCYLWATQSD